MYIYIEYTIIILQIKIHIIDNKATPSAYALTVLEFKNLNAKELAFVYFTTDHRSPFAVYDWDQRTIEVKNSIFGENSKYKPDQKVLAACKKYDMLIFFPVLIYFPTISLRTAKCAA